MSKEEVVQLAVQTLRSNDLVIEIEASNSDECVGVEDGDIYVTIIHHYDLMSDDTFNGMCLFAKMESSDCIDRETKEYETQLVF